MKIAIIGAGLIGRERIQAVQALAKETDNISISSVFDTDKNVLSQIKNTYNVNVTESISDTMQLKPDWVFISTPNHVVKDIAKQAFDIGANVLLEKPFGRSLKECDDIIKLKPPQCKLNVGFNYRFFAGIEAALQDARSGKFGKLISVNLILGHGNSPGMEKSWKLDPIKCGDVCTDLGGHLIDLINQLSSGDVNINYAKSWRGYWNTGIAEEVHWISTDTSGTVFNAQVSLNRWRSTFKLEINGTEGYGIVDGRGRSYGPQSYKFGKRWAWLDGKNQCDTEQIIIDKDDCSNSFIKETASVLGLSGIIKKYNSPLIACSYKEARNTMNLLDICQEKYK